MKVHKTYTRDCDCGSVFVRIRFVAGRTNGTWSQHVVLLQIPTCYYDDRYVDECLLGCAGGAVELGDDVCFTQLLNYDRVEPGTGLEPATG